MIDLRLRTETLAARTAQHPGDLVATRGGVVVGFISTDGWGGPAVEATGAVLPAARRSGVGRALLVALQEQCRAQAAGRLLVLADRGSRAARPLLSGAGATLAHAEHVMQLDASAVAAVAPRAVTARQATPAELPLVAALIAADWGAGEEFALETIRGNTGATYYLVLHGETPIGTLNVQIVNGRAYIYGFSIAAEHRRRGFGRQALMTVIDHERAHGALFLEVDEMNAHAYVLYCSVGFRTIRTFDYWDLPLNTR